MNMSNQDQQPIIRFDVAGERESWEQYFKSDLAGTLRNLTDGTVAQIGALISNTNFQRKYKAYIGVSCDTYAFKPWLRRNPHSFCVLHMACGATCEGSSSWVLERSCFLTPMHGVNQCYFLPTDLPRFDSSNRVPPPVPEVINICITGGMGFSTHRDYALSAGALAEMRPDEGVLTVTIFHRKESIPSQFIKANVSHLVQVKQEPRYKEFHEAVSRCHILLPLVKPASDYFAQKRLTGSLPLIVAHKIPSVMHTALEEVNHDVLCHAPVRVYNDSQTFVSALEDMMQYLRHSIC